MPGASKPGRRRGSSLDVFLPTTKTQTIHFSYNLAHTYIYICCPQPKTHTTPVPAHNTLAHNQNWNHTLTCAPAVANTKKLVHHSLLLSTIKTHAVHIATTWTCPIFTRTIQNSNFQQGWFRGNSPTRLWVQKVWVSYITFTFSLRGLCVCQPLILSVTVKLMFFSRLPSSNGFFLRLFHKYISKLQVSTIHENLGKVHSKVVHYMGRTFSTSPTHPPRLRSVHCGVCHRARRLAHCFPAPSCHPHFHPWTPNPHCCQPNRPPCNIATIPVSCQCSAVNQSWNPTSKSLLPDARVSTSSFCKGSSSIRWYLWPLSRAPPPALLSFLRGSIVSVTYIALSSRQGRRSPRSNH